MSESAESTNSDRWHHDEQEFLAKLEQQCNAYHEHHNKDHLYYQKLSSKFNVPILVISALNALCAIALNDFLAQRYVSILNAVLSSGTGVLGSIQLYLKINEKMTNSVRASTLMKRLALKISKELSIDMSHRVTDGQAFMSDCFAEFNTALEQGNPVEKGLYNHMAFTQLPKKEKVSLMTTLANMSPRKSSIEFSSNGNLSRLGEPRAKRLWGLVDKVRTDAHFLGGSATPFRPTGSSPGGSSPAEQDEEIGVRGS
jgi:hypothetical protein